MKNQKIDKQEEKTMKEKYKKDGTKVEIKVASDAKVSRKEKTFRMCLIALLIAIMLVMNFTPIGYISTGFFSITLMTIPVVVGAISLGPVVGMILGAVFGLTSFLQCFGIGYVIDPSAALLFNTNPFFAFVTCFLPRILMGLGVALIFRAVLKINKIRPSAYPISAASGTVLNTALFMTCYITLYKNTVLAGASVFKILLSVISLNFLIELCVSLVLGTAIALAFNKALKLVARK